MCWRWWNARRAWHHRHSPSLSPVISNVSVGCESFHSVSWKVPPIQPPKKQLGHHRSTHTTNRLVLLRVYWFQEREKQKRSSRKNKTFPLKKRQLIVGLAVVKTFIVEKNETKRPHLPQKICVGSFLWPCQTRNGGAGKRKNIIWHSKNVPSNTILWLIFSEFNFENASDRQWNKALHFCDHTPQKMVTWPMILRC